MSVIVFIICLISCIASIIGYLRRKYKWRSRFMQSNRKLNHYDKRSPYDIYTRDIDIDAPNPYNVYKLFVGQNKNSDYQQREHDYHWYRFDRYELTSSKKYIFTNIVLCIAMAVMIIHYTFLVMDGVAILEGGYQYIPLLISVAICTNKLITKYKAYKIAKVINNIYDNISYIYGFKNTFFYLKTNNKWKVFYLQIYYSSCLVSSWIYIYIFAVINIGF